MSVSATDQSPFPYGDKLFPDSYFGQTEPVKHNLPIFSDKGSPSFKDVLDTLNPLQHIPIISTIYRAVTGDEPAAGSRLAGAALYGGPIGVFGELINCAIDDNTGKDIGGHMLAMAEDAFGSSPSDGGSGDTKLAAAPEAKGTETAEAAPPAAPAAAVATAEPPPPVAAPQQAVAVEPVKLASAQAAPRPETAQPDHTMPLSRAQPMRFMPVPERHAIQPVQPPPITASLSTSGEMSHVPVTGRPTYTSAGPSAATVQKILAAQGEANQPLGAGPPGMTTAAGADSGAAGGDWFSTAMSRALDKYEKTSRLTPTAPAATTASP